jgi:formylglycine-generating enzyme required for sulfatase activity
MGNNPSRLPNCDECPVDNVSWEDVQQYLQKLNESTGEHYRLPTEAEWEYAAHGGNKSLRYTYSGSNNMDEVAWYSSNASAHTHPVGQKKPNELGIYDMSGNVSEWCSDRYDKGYYSNSPVPNPQGPNNNVARVLRGGSWGNGSGYCRVSSRDDGPPTYRNGICGFRLAKDSK